jgi:hypothetical protein
MPPPVGPVFLVIDFKPGCRAYRFVWRQEETVKAICMILLLAALIANGCGRSEEPAAGANPEAATGSALLDALAAEGRAATRSGGNGGVSASTEGNAANAAPVQPPAPEYVDVAIPEGTRLSIALRTGVASDTSRVEDRVRGELRSAVVIDGREVLSAGVPVDGFVTTAIESGRVKGRARLAFEFASVVVDGERYEMRTRPIDRTAPATKGEDATKIAIGAGAGAAVGGLIGGKKGAATGAAVGGGAGTGVVLATKGEEVRFNPNDRVTTSLASPLTVRVRQE